MDVYHNHTEQEYPPTRISSALLAPGSVWSTTTVATWNATITGQPYANGLYKISSAGAINDAPQWFIFNAEGATIGGHWTLNNYNGGAGTWNRGTNPMFTLDNTYYGDWVSIQLPEPIVLSSCTFIARSNLVPRAPSKFKIYGSNDGVSWTVLHTQTSALAYSSLQASVTLIEKPPPYTYFGLVVGQLGAGGSILNFIKWKIFGKVHPHSAMCATVRIICISAYKYSHMNSDDWYIWPHILLCYT
jgi:hypothetical protein